MSKSTPAASSGKSTGAKDAEWSKAGAISAQGVGSGALPRKPRRLCPSDLTRPSRFARRLEGTREDFRRQQRLAGHEVDEALVDNLALRWLIDEVQRLADKAGVDIPVDAIVVSLGADKNAAARLALRVIAAKLGVRTGPTPGAMDPDDINAHVEVRCLRETDEWQQITAELSRNPGAPPSSYRLALACLEAMAMERGDFEVRRQWRSFVEMNLIRGWAYDCPAAEDPELAAQPREKLKARADCALSEQGVCYSLFGVYNRLEERDATGLRRVDPLNPVSGGILNRADLDVLARVNAKVVAKLSGTTRPRRCGIDGMKVRAPRLQTQSVSLADEQLINRSLKCDLGYHGGDDWWRGWMLLWLYDLDDGWVYGWVLVNASRPEEDAFNALMAAAYKYMPWLNVVEVSADSAFDKSDETSRIAEQVWGCHPLFARRGSIGDEYDFAADEGIPSCHRELMQQVSCDNFYDAVKRQQGLRLDPKVFPARAGKTHHGRTFTYNPAKGQIGCDDKHRYDVYSEYDRNNNLSWYVKAPPGIDIAPLVDLGLLPRAVIKWRCRRHPECTNLERTYPDWEKVLGRRVGDGGRSFKDKELRSAWRVYQWAPRKAVAIPGREDRFAIRQRAQADHFARVEGFNGEMRDRGITLDGNQRPRAVKTYSAMCWLVGLRALRHNLARLVHSTGAYEVTRKRAEADDLLRAVSPADLDAHRQRKADRDAGPDADAA